MNSAVLNSVPTNEVGPQNSAVELQGTISPVGEEILIAFLPLENLSGTKAPLKEIGRSYRASLTRKGFRLLDSELLEKFRKKHRMRYTGGVSSIISEALLQEMKVDAILITSLEAYQNSGPPQISLISRLVTSGIQPEIIWMNSVGLSGDESPGFLDLTLIRAPQPLLEKAVDKLSASLAANFVPETLDDDASLAYLPFISPSWHASGSGTLTSPRYRLNRKYLPYDYFRSPVIDPDKKYSIAVIPMLNLAVRKNAGKIASLHYVRELFNLKNFEVIEPGLVREQLLRFRAIMPAGPSLAVADLISSDGSLGVDLVLSGKVFDYQNKSTNPKVDYSVQIIEKKTREVVFGARTFSTGLDGVFFFNVGRVYAAHNLLEEMSRVTVQLLSYPFQPWEESDDFIAQKQMDKVEKITGKPETVVSADDGDNNTKLF